MDKDSKISRVLYEHRMNQMQGLMGLIKIGGSSDIEKNMVRDKLVDGLNSVRNSVLEGIIPGGGSALVHASKVLDFLEMDQIDEQVGVDILKKAIREPFRAIISNFGRDSDYFLQTLLKENDLRQGKDLSVC